MKTYRRKRITASRTLGRKRPIIAGKYFDYDYEKGLNEDGYFGESYPYLDAFIDTVELIRDDLEELEDTVRHEQEYGMGGKYDVDYWYSPEVCKDRVEQLEKVAEELTELDTKLFRILHS